MGELLPYSIYYENSAGKIIRFDEAPIVVQTTGLFDWQWNISAYDRAIRDGGKAIAARRPVQDRTLVLDVFADTQQEHDAAIDRLHDILEYDICALSPGRLWINDRYVRCFASASVKTVDRNWSAYTVVGLTVKLISPAWVKEETITVIPLTAAADTADRKYPGQYPYKYSEGGNVARFINSTACAAPMIIKIFGACSNPSVYIGGNEYSVNTTVAAGDYVIIDQRDKSIYRIGQNGTRSNIFNLRKKSVDNFQYAPSGSLTVSCSGQFSCEVTFLTQRSEPEWT
ncbi:MAG: hypothetical protein IJM51_01595 [Clostridia bacterium]|nr:hypothetical protein [Clostridia bacterium]